MRAAFFYADGKKSPLSSIAYYVRLLCLEFSRHCCRSVRAPAMRVRMSYPPGYGLLPLVARRSRLALHRKCGYNALLPGAGFRSFGRIEW
jgi:hypothetical protein